jgi:hypothetical protein
MCKKEKALCHVFVFSPATSTKNRREAEKIPVDLQIPRLQSLLTCDARVIIMVIRSFCDRKILKIAFTFFWRCFGLVNKFVSRDNATRRKTSAACILNSSLDILPRLEIQLRQVVINFPLDNHKQAMRIVSRASSLSHLQVSTQSPLSLCLQSPRNCIKFPALLSPSRSFDSLLSALLKRISLNK